MLPRTQQSRGCARSRVPLGEPRAEGAIYASGAHTGGYTLFLSEDALDDAEKLLRTEATTRHGRSRY